MKSLVLTLAGFCVGVAVTAAYLNSQKAAAIPTAIESPPVQATEQVQPDSIAVSKPEPPLVVSDAASTPLPATNSTPLQATNSVSKRDVISAALRSAVDTLISPQASFKTRRELWQKLKEAGQLDQVISELKQRAMDNPNDPEIQTALGVGLMNKFPVRDFNEAATLGMEIDQSFNNALKLDPANWEAQYEKANAMSHWPSVAGNKGPEIIQRLSSLIDQQDTMLQQPEFAKTYILLGNQYQKEGQPNQALATWALGLAKFPNDPALQKKVNGQ